MVDTVSADDIEVPRWVCPEHRSRYRKVAAVAGEEQAAAWAREAKRTGIADLPLSLSALASGRKPPRDAAAASPSPPPPAAAPAPAARPRPPTAASTQPKAPARPPRRHPEPPIAAPVTVNAGPIGILALRECHCRWPVEVDGETLYCGRVKVAITGAYCAEHAERAAPPRGAGSAQREETAP